jgi:BirA family biotin operon repressor/biotin-[acetyl-CoA-carboxylase] ligase
MVMTASLAVAETVEAVSELPAAIKWPNDVLINGKKVCGIIAETGKGQETPDFAVVGIGLNVNINMEACPEIKDIATSLSAEAGREFSRVEVLRQLLARFEYWYQGLDGAGRVFEAWRARLVTLGKRVTARAGSRLYEGLAEDVAPDGTLMLRLADDRILKLPAGDVSLRL